jgi:uncharacterized protein YndB with AHSA1/START domain
MPDIIHRIGIKASPAAVYQALSTIQGLAGWWTEETTGEAGVGGKITFTFRSPSGDVVGAMVMEVEALREVQSVRWRCVDGPPDWIGTHFTFDLSEQDGQTILMFGHRDWAESTESMAHCSMKWAVFLLSLKDLVLTGKGRPSPGDLKIDNWN